MPRTEVYQLRLTKDEKAELAEIAHSEGMSIANLIRDRCLINQPAVIDRAQSREIVREITAPVVPERAQRIHERMKQLVGQGYTSRVALNMARKEFEQ